ncbi:MAG: B12-binding domain-containing radical SAM protein [Deltaproteobacteria bacterium]|nr:B12-binding domain-containing radical SAM protein [Deltaproteobacteria bacterium]
MNTLLESIVLIIPPSVFLLDERVFMSLGILKVAAVLEKCGHTVEVVDLSGVENYEEAITLHTATTQSHFFGLTATTPQLPAAFKIAKAIRSQNKNTKIILGGPHVTLVAAALKRERARAITNGRAHLAFESLKKQFDILVAGDGELAIHLALKKNAPSYIDADDPKTTLFLKNAALNEFPFPARHLVDVDSYKYTIDGIRALSLIAQLGCPYECGFCGGRYSPYLRRIRMRTSQNIIEEIRHMYRTYHIKGFMLYDDELNVNPKMVELMNGITELQKREHTEFRLRGFIKSQLFTDEQAKAMYEAGFRWILVGFESGSPLILRNINKRATREENTQCMEIAKRHGLKVKALMSFGHPGESPETIQQTLDWLLEVKPDDFDMTIITTYPGTPYYDDARLYNEQECVWVYEFKGDRLYSYEVDYMQTAKYYKGDPNGGYQSYVYTDALSPEELVRLRDLSEKTARKKLNIPYPSAAKSIRYEHSMGQFGNSLPPNILRRSSIENTSASTSSHEWYRTVP